MLYVAVPIIGDQQAAADAQPDAALASSPRRVSRTHMTLGGGTANASAAATGAAGPAAGGPDALTAASAAALAQQFEAAVGRVWKAPHEEHGGEVSLGHAAAN